MPFLTALPPWSLGLPAASVPATSERPLLAVLHLTSTCWDSLGLVLSPFPFFLHSLPTCTQHSHGFKYVSSLTSISRHICPTSCLILYLYLVLSEASQTQQLPNGVIHFHPHQIKPLTPAPLSLSPTS